MRIAIIGCRGIPNSYGGFEQLAEYLSVGLVKLGHEVFVYNSHNHPYREKEFNGVKIKRKYDPEHLLGTAGQFVYDFNCILDLKWNNFDVVYQLGYTSSSVWSSLLPSRPIIVTNMDGLEWKRTKYSEKVKSFLKYAERLAVKSSKYLISDSLGIKKYLWEKYQAKSTFIAYGAHEFKTPSEDILEKYNLKAKEYQMVLARFEPENNIETIVKGFLKADTTKELILVGNYTNKYGVYLQNKYSHSRVRFLGKIFDINILNNLRYHADLYFHGHSVGGTNPSLLEAMSSSVLICAHDNSFNKGVLGEDGFYFSNEDQVAQMINSKSIICPENLRNRIENSINKIRSVYSWEYIINQYNNFFLEVLEKERSTVLLPGSEPLMENAPSWAS